jgi:sugar phosphate permease
MKEGSSTRSPSPSVGTSLGVIARNPQTWLYGLYGLMMYIPLAGFADLWGTPYFQQFFHMDKHQAATIMSWLYIGLGCGAPCWSFMVTSMKSYRKPMALSAFFSLIFLTPIFYVQSITPGMVGILLFLSGIMISGQFLAFSGVTEINTPERTATASGTHNMICMLSGVLAQPLVGHCLDFKDPLAPIQNGIKCYSLEAFSFAFSSLPLALALSMILCFFMKESYGGLSSSKGSKAHDVN